MTVLAAVFCDSLMPYNSAVTMSNSSDIATTPDGYPYMTAAVYWCLDGRKFEDGTTVRTLFCVGNGYWSYPSVDCACTLCCLMLLSYLRQKLFLTSIQIQIKFI